VYRPLPKSLTIKESLIDGLGLFATEDIEEGTKFGISHIADVSFENGYIRTPLGGFVNHSDKQNCEFVAVAQNGSKLHLITIKDISVGEELVTNYWLYEVEK